MEESKEHDPSMNIQWIRNADGENVAHSEIRERGLVLVIKPTRSPGGQNELDIRIFERQGKRLGDELGNAFVVGDEQDVPEALDMYLRRLGQVENPEDIFRDTDEAGRKSIRELVKKLRSKQG